MSRAFGEGPFLKVENVGVVGDFAFALKALKNGEKVTCPDLSGGYLILSKVYPPDGYGMGAFLFTEADIIGPYIFLICEQKKAVLWRGNVRAFMSELWEILK